MTTDGARARVSLQVITILSSQKAVERSEKAKGNLAKTRNSPNKVTLWLLTHYSYKYHRVTNHFGAYSRLFHICYTSLFAAVLAISKVSLTPSFH